MALTLPYPSMSFVPLDVLTAEEMNHIVSNYTYIANQFPIIVGQSSGDTYNYAVKWADGRLECHARGYYSNVRLSAWNGAYNGICSEGVTYAVPFINMPSVSMNIFPDSAGAGGWCMTGNSPASALESKTKSGSIMFIRMGDSAANSNHGYWEINAFGFWK
jgi:hypothetical protein